MKGGARTCSSEVVVDRENDGEEGDRKGDEEVGRGWRNVEERGRDASNRKPDVSIMSLISERRMGVFRVKAIVTSLSFCFCKSSHSKDPYFIRVFQFDAGHSEAFNPQTSPTTCTSKPSSYRGSFGGHRPPQILELAVTTCTHAHDTADSAVTAEGAPQLTTAIKTCRKNKTRRAVFIR